jgi:hypothetical protein
MRRLLSVAIALSGALLMISGCRQADRAVSEAPTLAELPTFEKLEPTLPIVVAVEGAGDKPRSLIVPKFPKIVLTPEQREALGEVEPPEPDVLALYRPPPGPEQGVATEAFGMRTGISGIGGAIVGLSGVYGRPITYGYAGHYASRYGRARLGAGVGPPRSAVPGR